MAKVDLFTLLELNWSLPALWQNTLEYTYDELEMLGLPLESPFALLTSPIGHPGLSVKGTDEPVGVDDRLSDHL